MVSESELSRFTGFIGQYARLFILTGAGISTGSGIPAYRDARGKWLARTPIQYQDYVKKASTRQRYWARSMLGWPSVSAAQSNPVHYVLAQWQQWGRVERLVTQNVDGLHRQAGSQDLVELHGRIDQVVCLTCREVSAREHLQPQLELENSDFINRVKHASVEVRPDGDAEFSGVDFTEVACPACKACGGVLMPDVVFFGGSVPGDKVADCYQALERADALLVVGSTLTVYSGFRFAKRAKELGLPIAIVNMGETRADSMAMLKLEVDCVDLFQQCSGLDLALSVEGSIG